ncbi:MAG: hypothetical protein HY718_16925 [Planctomycetes bacterium]|nr:hypothetical protein [Planctomycetota bacterium]
MMLGTTRTTAWIGLGLLLAALATEVRAANDERASGAIDWERVLADPGDLQKQNDADRRSLEARLDEARDGLAKARAHLALANWWVAVPTARPATRWLLKLETATDRRSIAKAARAAEEQVDHARAILERAPSTGPEQADTKQQRRDLLQSADTIAAFAAVLHEADLEPSDAAAKEKWRKAGRGLAVARESSDADTAAAALLWQAFALNEGGNPERALEALPAVLAKPEHMPYDLMSRLLRCRLIAEAGESAAATTLLSRVDATLRTWMDNQNQERNNARRLVGLVQRRIVEQWIDRLRASTQPAAASLLEPLLKHVDRNFADVKTPNVYYMATAMPLKVKTPEVPKKTSADDSSADTRPGEPPARAASSGAE